MDVKMREEKLFLDPDMTLAGLSQRTGTNRTYASNAVCSRYRNFREYLNSLRVEHLLQDIREGICTEIDQADGDDFAMRYGFRSRRSLDRVLVRETGCTYLKIVRRRVGLKKQGCGR